ncbi:hypothetical protein SAMN04487781_0709 [Cellulosimicrobium cellulans]|nr:hypothetical protein SAMN04487781_0709 [Cellulosimicrobium cellulans]
MKNWTTLACAFATCLSIAGCSTIPADTSLTRPGPSSGKDRAQWTMPLDRYRIESNLDYVTDVLVEECMHENGFAYQRPLVDATATSETISRSGRNLFNVEIAARWGYSGAPDPNRDTIRAAESASTSWPQEKSDAYWVCLSKAANMSADAVRINNTIAALGASPWSEAQKDPRVQTAAADWFQCMQPLGFSDLPESPHHDAGGTPTPAMAASFGEIADGKSNVQTARQEAEEIRLAIFDANCRESSNYAQALYDAEWEGQTRVVEENQETLDALLAEKQAYERQVQDVLDKAGQ